MVSSQKSNEKYRPDIDGLRAIAILSVVLFHAGVPVFTGGFTGVDIFFVISGYLIGGHIVSEAYAGTFSFSSFYRRRAKRILPAFYLVIVFTILVSVVLLSPFEFYKFAKMAVASILSASNIYMMRTANYFRPTNNLNPLLMTWSLGVEEQFYFMIPALMALLMRFRRKVLLPAVVGVCTVSFVFAWQQLTGAPNAAFYLLPSRAWELGAGVVLAIFELDQKYKLASPRAAFVVSLTGVSLMVAPIALLKSSTLFPGPAALPSVLGTVLVIAGTASWINRQLLSFAPLVFIGRVSYSWYLWHWPLLVFLRIGASGQLTPMESAFAVSAAFVAAVFSYYVVERPFRMSSRAPFPLLIRYAAVSAGLVAVCAVIWMAHGFPNRYPTLADEGKPDDACLVSFGSSDPYLSPPCYAASDPRPAVALWGDSHSEALAPKLRELANAQGYNFVQLGKTSCMPLKGTAAFEPERVNLARECIQFNQKVYDIIASDQRIRIVVLAGRWGFQFRQGNLNQQVSEVSLSHKFVPPDGGRQLFVESLSAQVRSLQKMGKHVVVLGDVPNFDFDPALRYRMISIPIRRTVAALLNVKLSYSGVGPPAFVEANNTAEGLLELVRIGNPGLELVSLKTPLCNDKDLCVYMTQGRSLYWDEQHLTPAGADYALRNFQFPNP